VKTEELIDRLSMDPAPVDPQFARRQLTRAALAGGMGAAVLMAIFLRPRADLVGAMTLPMFWMKLAFPAAVAVVAARWVSRLGRPGARIGRLWVAAMALPFGILWIAAAAVLLGAAPGERAALVLGASWQVCAVLIALLAAPALAGILLALRSLGPTRLTLAGAAAGALSGSIGAFVYALHCTEMQVPFLAVWYVIGIALPIVAGATLARRALRW